MPICRMCLAVNVRVFAISGTPLHFIYEKLTTNTLWTADQRPVAACYVCYAQLNKFRNIMLTAAKAERVLTAIYDRHKKFTVQSVSMIDRKANGLSNSLSVFKPEPVNIPSSLVPSEVEIKIEPGMNTDITCNRNDTDATKVFIRNIKFEGNEEGRVIAEENEEGRVIDEENEEGEVNAEECEEAGQDWSDVYIEIEQEKSDDSPMSPIVDEHEDSSDSEADDNIPLKALSAVQHESSMIEVELDTLEDGGPGQPIPAEASSTSNHKPQNLQKGSSKNLYECNICQKQYKHTWSLKMHLLTHSDTPVRPYECELCQRPFTRMSHLKAHLLTHGGVKLHECNICHKRFSDPSTLRAHIRIHTGEKPFACNICDRRFNHRGQLKNHVRTHTGEKPHECNFCHQRFIQRSALTRHVRIHTGELPFECNFCFCRFRHNTTKLRHVRKHTGDTSYKCNVCDLQKHSDTQITCQKVDPEPPNPYIVASGS